MVDTSFAVKKKALASKWQIIIHWMCHIAITFSVAKLYFNTTSCVTDEPTLVDL
jgi:hypothetical protein